MGNAVASLITGVGRAEARPPVAAAVDVKNAKGVEAIIAGDGKGEAEAPAPRAQGVLVATAGEVHGGASIVKRTQTIPVEGDGEGEDAVGLGHREAPVAADAEAVADVPVIALDGQGEAPPRGVPVVAAAQANGKTPAVEGTVQAVAVAVEEGKAKPVKWLKHYSSAQSILIVGDGDFSFSRALAAAFGSGKNLVATSLDSYEDLEYYYREAVPNIMELKRMRTTVLHGVDATTMKGHADLEMRRFDRIVFNFPHAGLHGRENGVVMISLHKELVRGFFLNARHLLSFNGEIHVTHKTGHPYDRWDIERLASEASLVMVKRVSFRKEDYTGYNEKRGYGAKRDKPLKLGACCTFKFCIRDTEESE